MKYDNTYEGIFISRPNRFIAVVDIDGKESICHVKNTGRCRELLIPGVKVILTKSNDLSRKTEYDLISVYKGEKLINIDSIAPNKVFGEWIRKGSFFDGITLIRPERTFGASRFDYYIECGSRRIFVEIKGVTLEENGTVLFPDAPTERGIKHINELIKAKEEGFGAYIFFIIQMKDCTCFTPNKKMHPQFAEALSDASTKGVNICALNCNVYKDGLDIDGFIDVRL